MITPRFVRFVKTYKDSTRDAVKSDIIYQTEDAGYNRDMHHGNFRSNKSCGHFYIEKPMGHSPFQMAISWYDLKHDDESGQKRLF
ncbi:hypothetical protein DRJ17_00410 [Candidatus Woesearchaeota archaeon]|nr:MAG: hypothetical protein DRJ17_00410 [Candidatus Woesearchaeota archaeon]